MKVFIAIWETERKKCLHLMFKDDTKYKTNNPGDIVNSLTMPYLHRGKKISRKLVFKYLKDLKNRGTLTFTDYDRFFFEDSETCEQISYKYKKRLINVQTSLIYSVDINDNYYKEITWLRQ